jgi:SAM-dependent methyltransferase
VTSFKVVKELHPSTHNTAQAKQLLQLEHACYRSHQYLHAISQDVLERAEADFGKAATSKVVHLGVQDNSRNRRARLNRARVRVLFVGRLERRKGVDLLLEAAATLIDEHLDIEFYLVGSDSIHTELANQNYQKWFEQTFSSRPDILSRVVFVGPVSEEELHQHYADASIFCLPSRYESLGLVLMEAMSFGLPVVASNTGGMKEVVAHQSDGILFEPESANALAAAIRLLATDPETRVQMGKAARESFESRFDTAITVPRALEYYQAIVQSFAATRTRRRSDSVILSRFAELIKHCSKVDERLARRVAEELIMAPAASAVADKRKRRSNRERLAKFLSGIPGSFGRNKMRIKRILSIVERQDANVGVAIKSLSAAQSDADRKLEALFRETRVLQDQVSESHRMLVDRNGLAGPTPEALASVARRVAEIREAQDDLARRISEGSSAQRQLFVEQRQLFVELANQRPEVDPKTIEALLQRVSHIQERLEFARTEILFEFGGRGWRGLPGARAIDAKHLVTEGDIRLNLGCGHMPLAGYVNIDNRDLPGDELVCDVSELPFPESSVTEIYSSHLLEHFPVEVLSRKLLAHWVQLMKPGGLFRAVVPDAECMIDAYTRREMSFDDLRTVTFGLQKYAGDFHFNMFSRTRLQSILSEAGLTEIGYTFTGRRNGSCFDMEIEGRSPR